jgi:hypothetical protein
MKNVSEIKHRRSLVTGVVGVLLITSVGLQPANASSDPLVEIAREGSEISLTSSAQHSLEGDYKEGDVVASGAGFDVSVGRKMDGAVQLLIEIVSESSPENYDFAVPSATHMEKLTFEGGEIYRLVDVNENTVAWLAPPWARDSAGLEVQTSFEFSNGVLRQIVDHSGTDVEYPITADPFLGIALISNMSISPIQSTYKLSIAVTPWVGVIYAGGVVGILQQQAWIYGVAYTIMSTDGWSEVLSLAGTKYGLPFRQYVATRATYKNQWDCHALGAPGIFAGQLLGDPNTTWDLEGNRYSTTNLTTWVSTLCNW